MLEEGAISEESSDENEDNKSSAKKKMTLFKTGLKKKMTTTTVKEESKEKKGGGMIVQLFKEEWKNCRKSPEKNLTSSTESLQLGVEGDDKDSDSKLKKLKTGLERKFKDIREDIVDIRDESLHSLNELKEEYQEKAEAKKAIITSFTEEEVRNLRRGSPLISNQVTKQMSCLYLSRRYSILRFSVLSGQNIVLDKARQNIDSLLVKVSIGSDRWRSRLVTATESPVWRETASLTRQTEEEGDVRVELLVRGPKENQLLGVGMLQLSEFPADSMTRMTLPLDNDASVGWQKGTLDMVLWVTSTNMTLSESPEVTLPEQDNDIDEEFEPFQLNKTLEKLDTVGVLEVQVMEATGLGSSKLQGSVNPFVLLELDNQYHRTKTITRNKNPVWDKKFAFTVRDAFSLLKISVLGEKMNSPQIVLGRIVLRLSQLRRDKNQDLWIRLKDRKLRKSAKGENPRLHLKISYMTNILRSAVTVFKNKEELLYEEQKSKFDRTLLLRNVNRIKRFLPRTATIQRIKLSYTEAIAWTNPARTVKYFVFYMFFVYYFQLWWIPVYTLYCLFSNYRNKRQNRPTISREESIEEEEDDDDTVSQEEKKSLKQSLDSLQNILLEFQEGCGLIASYLEKISNMFQFEEPFLSFLFCLLLLLVSLVLWIFGLRTVLLLWGVNKFTKKLRDSDPVPTNELDNLILRVPDFEVVEDARSLDLDLK